MENRPYRAHKYSLNHQEWPWIWKDSKAWSLSIVLYTPNKKTDKGEKILSPLIALSVN
jgi:hypothetical protein